MKTERGFSHSEIKDHLAKMFGLQPYPPPTDSNPSLLDFYMMLINRIEELEIQVQQLKNAIEP